MNFKESYKQEMDLLKETPGLTKKAISKAQEKSITKKKYKAYTARKMVFAAALVCIIGVAVQHDKIISFAEDIIGRFTLSAGNLEMEFGEIQPIPMNVDRFIKDAGTNLVLDWEDKAELPYSYFNGFDSYEDMHKVTNIVLPCADKVEYRQVGVQIVPEDCCGHISAQIIYDGVSYNAAGMYTIKGFNQDSWGFGDDDTEKVEKYKYGDGKYACFIENPDGNKSVYFCEENILFKMSFDNGISIKNGDATATKEQVEKLLKLFGNNK